MITGIYKIINTINNKIYIGQTNDFEKRIKQHKFCKKRKPLYLAFLKYGIDNFNFEMIEECAIADLDEREAFYLNLYKSYERELGYNLARRPGLNNRGCKFSPETISRMRLSQLGKKATEETKLKQSLAKRGEKHPNWGKKMPKEFGEKISKILKAQNRQLTQDHIDKISAANSIKVKQICKKTGEVIRIWDSISDAAKSFSGQKVHICRVCMKKNNSAYGFFWEYLADQPFAPIISDM